MFNMLHKNHKNRKLSRDDFRARSQKRFNFLKVIGSGGDKGKKEKGLVMHEAMIFKREKLPKK
jgi:hypothetical protein